MNKEQIKNLLIQYPTLAELSHCDEEFNYYEAKVNRNGDLIDEPLTVVFAVDCELDHYDNVNALELIEWYSYYEEPTKTARPLPQLELNFN